MHFEGLPPHPNEIKQKEFLKQRRKNDLAAFAKVLVFAGITLSAYLGFNKIDARRAVESAQAETTPRATQVSSNESLYVTQAREIAREMNRTLLVYPERLNDIDRQHLTVDKFPRAIPQGTTIMERGVSRLVIDYDNNPFQDELVTFINQGSNSEGEYMTAQHLNRIYFVTPEENQEIMLRQYTYSYGGDGVDGPNQERVSYTMEAGVPHAIIPIISPNLGENSTENNIRLNPETGGATFAGGHQTLFTGEYDKITEVHGKGTVLLLLRLSPFDPSSGEQALSVMGVVDDHSLKELRNGGGVGLEPLEYVPSSSSN